MSNSSFNTYIVRNFNDYIRVIKSIREQEDTVWFRGQANASYRLLPSAIRNGWEVANQFGENFKPKPLKNNFHTRGTKVLYPNPNKMLEEFKKLAQKEIRITPKNNLEWMALAQHYGLPTLLLDWSTDPLVALYFSKPEEELIEDISIEDSIENFKQDHFSDLGAAIFAINPGKMNSIFYEFKNNATGEPINYPLDILRHEDLLKNYEEHSILPCCVTTSAIDRRICRQSGNFTIHGSMVWPIDLQSEAQKAIYKIFIPYGVYKELNEILDTLDINNNTIYGESNLDVASKEIRAKATIAFSNEIERLSQKFKGIPSPSVF